jgi:tetratricopeptide (TPR) repeat protein
MRRLSICCALLLASGAASADDTASAREHFKHGIKAYDLGHYAEAATEFEAAYRAQDEPALLFNLGQAYRFGGDYAAAIRCFRSYLRRMPQAANRAEVEARIVDLQKLLDEQNRQKEKPPSGAITPAAEPAPPVRVSQPPVRASQPWPPARALRIAGLTLLSAGAVSLVLGAAFAGLAASAHHDANSPPSGVFDPALEDRMNLYQHLDVAFFVAGGVLAAGGLATFLVGKLHRPIEVTPVAGPGRAGASLTVAF